jgi:hypothetical protein
VQPHEAGEGRVDAKSLGVCGFTSGDGGHREVLRGFEEVGVISGDDRGVVTCVWHLMRLIIFLLQAEKQDLLICP